MTIKKFIKIKNTLGVYTISDWVPIKQEKNSKCLVLNNKNISNNWFLLGIRHSETDKKVKQDYYAVIKKLKTRG